MVIMICGHQSFSPIKAKDTTRYHNVRKCSAVAEMGDRLATIDMGRKEGGGCCTIWPWPRSTPYQVTSWSTQPFGQNRHEPKRGTVLLWRGQLDPHLSQCGHGPSSTSLPIKAAS